MLKTKGKTILSINVKCSDMYSHVIYGKDGKVYREYSGYVPSFFPGEHYGDYVLLDICPYTGRIFNWKNWKRSKTKGKTK